MSLRVPYNSSRTGMHIIIGQSAPLIAISAWETKDRTAMENTRWYAGMHAWLSEAGAEHHGCFRVGNVHISHLWISLQTAVTEGVFCPAFHSRSVSVSRLNASHGSKLSVDGASSTKVTSERCARHLLFLIHKSKGFQGNKPPQNGTSQTDLCQKRAGKGWKGLSRSDRQFLAATARCSAQS